MVNQRSIMETMTPLDFLDFRDLLRPASGFQSIQFKIIEATLGLAYDQRHGKGYYLSQLSQHDIDLVKQAESEESLLSLINKWLERMPYANDEQHWNELCDAFDWIFERCGLWHTTISLYLGCNDGGATWRR